MSPPRSPRIASVGLIQEGSTLEFEQHMASVIETAARREVGRRGASVTRKDPNLCIECSNKQTKREVY